MFHDRPHMIQSPNLSSIKDSRLNEDLVGLEEGDR